VPQKYCTNDFTSICVQRMKYNHGEKIAMMQQCSTE